ncbi:hypothetical protein FVEG_16347 [Fusarium verticillioides 7600]|uniref:Uncharacterized protein n=1 Tax=Gibberella moniliformis (strain M3125 / FGSC 7600) TaxID=334819 RepID=W7MB34_GIBM7|nr:hypothetical protein FVEG_16347 [Fusarium verticillioides 7600]EWG48858.1 hypothetical protein FVEG_16347 [Fusarium verticillioides 7600]
MVSKTHEAWTSFLPLISSPRRWGSFSASVFANTTLYMQSIPKTARLSDITNEVGFWQACRSATALGKSEGNGARGDAATTPDVSNHGAAAIRKLGRRAVQESQKCRSAAHTERWKRDGRSERGYHHRRICSD